MTVKNQYSYYNEFLEMTFLIQNKVKYYCVIVNIVSLNDGSEVNVKHYYRRHSEFFNNFIRVVEFYKIYYHLVQYGFKVSDTKLTESTTKFDFSINSIEISIILQNITPFKDVLPHNKIEYYNYGKIHFKNGCNNYFDLFVNYLLFLSILNSKDLDLTKSTEYENLIIICNNPVEIGYIDELNIRLAHDVFKTSELYNQEGFKKLVSIVKNTNDLCYIAQVFIMGNLKISNIYFKNEVVATFNSDNALVNSYLTNQAIKILIDTKFKDEKINI